MIYVTFLLIDSLVNGHALFACVQFAVSLFLIFGVLVAAGVWAIIDQAKVGLLVQFVCRHLEKPCSCMIVILFIHSSHKCSLPYKFTCDCVLT